MDELLPVLVARLAHRDIAVPIIQAALRRGVAFVALEEAPSSDGPHALELHTPQWTEPLLLLAEPAGDPLGNEFPLQVQPFAVEHEELLMALLAEAGASIPPPEAQPIHLNLSEPPPVDPRLSIPPLDLGFTDPPPIDLRLSEPPVDLGFSELPDVELRMSELPPADVTPSEPPPSDSLAPAQLEGRTLGGGKYLIEAMLGSGGMGTVYRGTHVALEKTIAIKVLHPSHRRNEDFLAAFHREALAASRLDHPNVVQVLDFGQEADGLLYITMELLTGRDLRAALDEQHVQPLARIVDVMTQVCAALSASHDQNVVHRDIKPENIILVPKRDDDGTVREVVKVCDFGIAEILGKRQPLGGAEAASRSQVSGTPDYMSPEQVTDSDVDARADIYACGVIMYEMAAGKVPFHALETPAEIAWAHVQREAPPPSSINPSMDRRLQTLIQKAMNKEPSQRHQSARELRADLRALLDSARRDALLDSFADVNDIPVGALPTFERNDAIDIGDLLSLDPLAQSKPGAVKEQIWVLSEQMATALIADPAAVLARLDATADLADYARDTATLERAMAALATRGAAASLGVVVAHLVTRAGGVAPGERSREAVAARALRSIEKPELLLRIAEEALDGAPAARDPARKVLVSLGGSGAHALCTARERASALGAAWGGRHRFVTAFRELGAAGLSTLAAFLQQADLSNTVLLEDLLRAVPEAVGGGGAGASRSTPYPGSPDAPHEPLGALLSTRHIRHESPAVRRAAATALAAVWGSRANAWLAPLLEDPDDGLRMAATGALRKHGGVERELVRRLERILAGAVPAGSELRVAAAGALVDTSGPARAQAVEALALVLRPAGQGFLSKLVTAETHEDPMVIATMAQVMLAIGGAEGARVVEARAARSSGDLRRQLQELLAGHPAQR